MDIGKLLVTISTAYLVTIGFGIVLNVSRKNIFISGTCGILSWTIYVYTNEIFYSEYVALIIASFGLGIYSEILAYRLKAPATVFSIAALIPLVPGSGVYQTMLAVVNGNVELTNTLLFQTLSKSASIAIGMLLASGLIQIYKKSKLVTKKDFIRGFKRVPKK